MSKDNYSINTGTGGVSHRDSVKNYDFVKMAKHYWEQAWTQMAAYVDNIPDVAGIGADPYTNSQFSMTRNYDTVLTGIDTCEQVTFAGLFQFLGE
jgi:hypothetical protein